MKFYKMTFALLLLLVVSLGLAGCKDIIIGGEASQESVQEISIDVDIREKMFIGQVQDIYLNANDYMDKAIRLEGMFLSVTFGDMTYYSVLRYGPGCCGNDGEIGFEVYWDNTAIKRPTDGDWVEAIGRLERYDEYGVTYLHLNLSSLQVLPERGELNVLQ